MVSTKDYLMMHPDATLEEYVNYCDTCSKKNIEQQKMLESNRDKWYEDLVGRYFMMNFNGKSFIIFKYTSTARDAIIFTYNIYKEKDNDWYIRVEKRPINKLWFNNPYEEFWLKQKKAPQEKVKELTPEAYEEFCDYFNSVGTKVADIINNF